MTSEVLSEVTEELRTLEERLANPLPEPTHAFRASIIADTFEEFGSSGHRYDAATVIRALMTQHRRVVAIEEFRTRALADGVVLATYVSREVDASRTALRSSIWRRGEGRWQILFHQGTRVAGTPRRRPGTI